MFKINNILNKKDLILIFTTEAKANYKGIRSFIYDS
jgi:hypothetical protein